jgi:chromosome partitioning protein
VNAKGGVGKTTTAINVGGGLNRLGRDVLLVDLDPHGVATEGLGHGDAYDADPPSLFDALTDPDSRHAVGDLVREGPEMDLLPANVDLLNAERELTVADLMARLGDARTTGVSPAVLEPMAERVTAADVATRPDARHLLDSTLAALDADYDRVVVDAPPFYGHLFDNAVYAAPNALVPALAEGTSQRAIELLFDEFGAVEAESGVGVDVLAAFANRVRASTNESERMVWWLEFVFEDCPVFEVPERVALQYAYADGGSIFEYDPDSDVADVYLAAAEAIDERLGGGA